MGPVRGDCSGSSIGRDELHRMWAGGTTCYGEPRTRPLAVTVRQTRGRHRQARAPEQGNTNGLAKRGT